ncbi:MAG: phage tail protein [Acutalibacteraceae bacterium]
MASGAKWFILNRKSDWQDGSITRNVKFKNDAMISDTKNGENGVYISSAFDSMEEGTVWHRFRADIEAPQSATYKFRFYASDSASIYIPVPGEKGQTRVDINKFIHDETVDVHRKIDMFDEIGSKCCENFSDILLCDLQGRYLWICIELIDYEPQPVKIKSMKIEFPQISFIDYLPEVYREKQDSSSFFSRFLGIFQSLYVDLEDKMDYVASNFDTEKNAKDFLDWMASWFSVKNATIWGEEKLRKLIKKCVKIYKIKGTKKAISQIVEEYVGVEPIIVEQFDVKQNMYYDNQKEVVENLFGDNGYVFTVMLSESQVRDDESYVELLKVISSVKPIDSICNLVILGDRIYLDHHCYMGMNSFISKNKDLTLDGEVRDTNNLVIKDRVV